MTPNDLLLLLILLGQITIKESELSAALEERDIARQDLSETHLAKDEIVKKAWSLRDSAVQRKNKAELEVAKTRIDMMQVNSQLMEAIQQKIQLSQQLEQVNFPKFPPVIKKYLTHFLIFQWQVDMQQLLDEQMKTKLSKLEPPKEPPKSPPESVLAPSQFERRRRKLLALFNFNGTTNS